MVDRYGHSCATCQDLLDKHLLTFDPNTPLSESVPAQVPRVLQLPGSKLPAVWPRSPEHAQSSDAVWDPGHPQTLGFDLSETFRTNYCGQ